jgi:hypothetical protein
LTRIRQCRRRLIFCLSLLLTFRISGSWFRFISLVSLVPIPCLTGCTNQRRDGEHHNKRRHSRVLLVKRSNVTLEQDVIDRESANDVSVPHKFIGQNLICKCQQKLAECLGVLDFYGSVAKRILDGLVLVSRHDFLRITGKCLESIERLAFGCQPCQQRLRVPKRHVVQRIRRELLHRLQPTRAHASASRTTSGCRLAMRISA